MDSFRIHRRENEKTFEIWIFSMPENGKVHSYFFMYKKVRVHKQVLYITNDV